MPRTRACLLTLLVTCAILPAACSRQAPAPAPVAEERPIIPADVIAPGAVKVRAAVDVATPPAGAAPVVADPQEKYEAALQDAVALLGEGKLNDALTSMQTAQACLDTEFVRGEIAKLRARIEQQSAADRTVQDIQTVLDQGQADEAARLAEQALQQYGAGDAAPALTRLKLQADALAATSLKDDGERFQRLRAEGQAALTDRNLRAAALACEQALQYGDDAELRKQLDDLHATLSRYDDDRKRAAELRRDPAQLEEAVALLQDAARAWDTLQIHQDIDEYTLALQQRRDRVAVAEFEVRGEVGIPMAGRVIGEELLPGLRPRFDVVERAQFGKVLDELKLEAAQLAGSPPDQREACRLAGVRYLVLGSVTRLGGLVVNARLVEAQTGLVVQTARVAAPTPEELLPLLPELGKLLLMTDEQRIRYEQQQAQAAQAVTTVTADAPLPPPPEPAAGQDLPPPPVLVTCRPPDLGGVRPEDFDRLPPPPAALQPAVVVELERERPVRQRLLYASLSLGDQLFRSGRFREAQRRFELALSLAPGDVDIRVRLDRCRPHLPPPVVVVAPVPPPPRLAVLDFVEAGDPAVVPPGLGAWTAQQVAPYFYPTYEIVDRGEVFWWMARLGMTYRDLVNDPSARRWLGRALNVRFFVLGTLRQTASFDATTHLVDAETGYLGGAGRIHVQDPWELKLRLGELARRTLLPPAERPRYEQDCERVNELVVKARLRTRNGEFAVAIGLFQDALKVRPDNVEVLALLQQNERQARQAALEAERRREFERRQAEAEACRRRQRELAEAAEAARRRAAAELAALDAQQRREREAERQRQCALAQDQLLLGARLALKTRNFSVSLQVFDSATSLRPTDNAFRELAQARAEAERAEAAARQKEAAVREAERARQRDAELARARQRLEEERRARLAEERALRQAQEQRDQAGYQEAFDRGQRLLGKGQYEQAAAAFQAARRLKKTDAVEALLSQALVEQARAAARARGEESRRQLEQQLAEEKARAAAAEALAKKNQDAYLQVLTLAQQALAAKRYDEAVSRYQDAGKLYRTDVVLTGLRQAEEGRAQARAAALAAERKKTEEAQRASRLQGLTTQGRLSLEAKQYGKAVAAFTQAKQLAPDNVDVLAGLARAQQAQEADQARAKQKAAELEREANLSKGPPPGPAAPPAKNVNPAKAITQAPPPAPKDTGAVRAEEEQRKAQEAARAAAQKAAAALQKQAEQARLDALRAQQQEQARKAEEQKRKQDFDRSLAAGRSAVAQRHYDEAIKAFQDALKLQPNDPTATELLRQATAAQRAALSPPPPPPAKGASSPPPVKTVQPSNPPPAKTQPTPPPSPPVKTVQPSSPPPAKTPPPPLPAKTQPAPCPSSAPLTLPPIKIQPPASPPVKSQPAPAPAKLAPPPTMTANPAQVTYQKHVQAGANLVAQKKYADAMAAYQEALKAVPGDTRATAALRSAEIALHLDLGQKAQQAGRSADAAREFEAVLRLEPGNREAQAGLSRARKK